MEGRRNGETERQRDGETERQRDGEIGRDMGLISLPLHFSITLSLCLSVSPSFCLSVSLSLHLCVSPSLRSDSLRAGSQTLAHLFLIPSRGRFDSLFVERQQPPVAHQQAAVNYGVGDVRRLRGVYQMRNDIIHRR